MTTGIDLEQRVIDRLTYQLNKHEQMFEGKTDREVAVEQINQMTPYELLCAISLELEE